MEQYLIECEECENITHVFSYDKPEFCPVCGRRADVEKRTADFDAEIEEDE
jgi:rRNA maturation endonuclease Nob1